jgi:hypothetical protein
MNTLASIAATEDPSLLSSKTRSLASKATSVDRESELGTQASGDTLTVKSDAQSGEGNDQKEVAGGRYVLMHHINFTEAYDHANKEYPHRVCNLCLHAAVESLGNNEQYTRLCNSAGTTSGPFRLSHAALLGQILALCTTKAAVVRPTLRTAHKVTDKQELREVLVCEHDRVLAKVESDKNFSRKGYTEFDSLDQGVQQCVYIESSGQWEKGKGWGKLVECGNQKFE